LKDTVEHNKKGKT
jgi:hypothetical protein